MNIKTIVLLFALSLLAFTSNGLNAQNTHNDAYFHDQTTPELRTPDNGEGLDFDDMLPTGGYGFTFDLFDESIGNGFEFDNFGNELGYNSLEFGDFDMAADDVSLGCGVMILGCLALMWFFLRLQDHKTTSV
ncbi:MAG: hypothetical protein J6R17_04675 [Bacteroidales bacterium]|nr:hypothetical protein [Bacteroidales bacterium]